MLKTTLLKILIPIQFLVCVIPDNTSGQVYNWKRIKYEAFVGLGATNFTGDVGVVAPSGEGFRSLVWVNPNAIRPVAQIGGRMALDPRQKLRLNLAAGMFYNDDKYGAWKERHLQFRSPIVELSGIYEFYVIVEKRKRTRYNWLNISHKGGFNFPATYLFSGLSLIYFNPQAYTQGKWHSLHPLHTEGQGLEGFKSHYSRINGAVPIGIGMKFRINTFKSITLEAGWRIAFSDYLDDVGDGKYPPTKLMLDNFGETAAILSNRRHGYENEYFINNPGGSERGGSWVDQYQFIVISYNAVLKTDRKGRPKLEFY